MLYTVSIFINNVANYAKKKTPVIVDFVLNNIASYFRDNVKSN